MNMKKFVAALAAVITSDWSDRLRDRPSES